MTDTQSFIDPLRLGVGTPDNTTFLRGDQTWSDPAASTNPSNVEMVYAQTSVQAGDTVANTTTATKFATKYTIPAGDLNVVGKVMRVRARGTARNNNAGVTIDWALLLGGTLVCANTVDTGNYGANNTVRGWRLEADVIVTSTGVAAALEAAGRVEMQTGGNASIAFGLTDGGTGIDLTIAEDLEIRVTWGAANANNTITMRQLIVEMLGPA